MATVAAPPKEKKPSKARAASAGRGSEKGGAQARRNKELGRHGEDMAARFLERRGLEILERNWTCPAGEADIIAREEDGTIVFVEVKTRSGVQMGMPEEAVTTAKRRRYEGIALYYISNYEGEEAAVRFDVVAITAAENGNALLRHHRGAFGTGW